ncbi:MAG: WYL domain-containing protein [Bacteroidota bacterium]
MASQQKLLRVFRLIRLLNTRPYKTVPQLGKLLDTTPRSIYRYLDFLGEVGYLIDKDNQNRYFIMHQADQKRDNLLDPDEAYYIQDTLQQIAPDHPLVGQIIAKLNSIQSKIPVASNLTKVQTYQLVQRLSEAIQQRVRVKLIKYYSASSQKISDRYIEPIHFDEGFTYLMAYDLKAQQERQFKIDRIQEVVLLHESIQNEHEAMPVDLFGFTGNEWLEAKLMVSNRAYRLLIEEFPESKAYLEEQNDGYLFQPPLRDWRGISRFILGLPGELEVLGPSGLVAHLSKEVERYRF